MLTLLDPEKLDDLAFGKEQLIERMRKYSLLSEFRIGWNYYMDYTWIFLRVSKYVSKEMKIIDIGAGPGALHGFLEKEYGVSIVGIDRDRWSKDYVDVRGDFNSKFTRLKNRIFNKSIDLIISASSFEHNPPKQHKLLVKNCLSVLKRGGHLVTTFAGAEGRTSYFKESDQWNLSKKDIERIYGDKFDAYPWRSVWKRWHKHKVMKDAYVERYGYWDKNSPPYLSVGADIIKD